MEAILVRSGLVLLYVFLFATLALTVLGLGGNWVLVGAALVIVLSGLGTMSWVWLAVIVAIALLGEAIEALLGFAVVAKRGGTRWGMAGMFAGGVAGVILGGPVAPPVGSVAIGFLGTFLGGAAGEYLRSRRAREAVRVGFWAFVGRSLATAGKLAAGLGIVWILIAKTW
jgi:uncharacterized protein YqgC (DUF456 family)